MNHRTINNPFVFIIFGASGDLARIKLFPSLYDLYEKNKFNTDFIIYGFARSKKSQEEFRKYFEESVCAKRKNVNSKRLKELSRQIFYFTGHYDNYDDYKKLFEKINSHKLPKYSKKVAYFSVPPQVFNPLILNLGKLKKENQENIQLIIEKPFGEDGNSAHDLFLHVSEYFDEDKEVYLLDHYLGKTGVQSILPLRYDNSILNLMLKGNVIKNIQITVKENFGIYQRAGYFDQVGIVKDMIQSHMLQIMALISMYIPVVYTPRNIQREKYNILSALRFPPDINNVILGQYASYRTEKDVPPSSLTATFVALRLFIDQVDWYAVPIYLRAGKKLDAKSSYITIEFKKLPFQKDPNAPTNKLILELYPNEKIHIRLIKKQSSESTVIYEDIVTSETLTCKGDAYSDEYGRLILEMLNEDKTNFLSFNEIIECWRLADYLDKFIEKHQVPIVIYHDNSQGPEQQHNLTKIDNNQWYEI
ncbi:hypothetical protein A2263_00700 [Candidatus Peregrinibacteria bacterium RIFOXYA2_FULL_33_21]|nr:MAG: hypothetical protein A2263_00700 [Candidatus Peregrinibacteria bacterium RIFOXYA2_FULL_33_21]